MPTGAIGATPDRYGVVTFDTPSGNIGCDMYAGSGGTFVDCAILQADYTFRQPPHEHLDCEGLALGTGKADVMCRGDVMQWQLDQQAHTLKDLPYGASLAFGPFVCHSDVADLSCWRPSTGHGFALSRQSYATW